MNFSSNSILCQLIDPITESCFEKDETCQSNEKYTDVVQIQHDKNTSLMCQDKKKRYYRNCVEYEDCEDEKSTLQCHGIYGIGICEHFRQKDQCKHCRVIRICLHMKENPDCKKCRRYSFCEHGRNKRFCKDCNGSGICQHKRQKYNCKDCGGSSICQHQKQRYLSHCFLSNDLKHK